MNTYPHMISPSTPPNGTASPVLGERAPAKQHQTHHFPSNVELPSVYTRKSTQEHRQVKGIALRFPSQSPHMAQTLAVRAALARKSLTLSREIKTHTA
jgi:hypothetical protein